ncbi:MAG: GGDEF domain-containing protein, partial [Treponema sp.]|nr:GGDEF domain-containing protein [Candidatus Treponema equifaecale]
LNKVQGNLSLEELAVEIKKDFLSLGITKAAICLYEKPIRQEKNNIKTTADWARVYFAFDESSPDLELGKEPFFDCSKSVLPREFNYILSGKTNIMCLYHGEYLYGYMVFKQGSLESFIYTLFCSVVAKSICSAYEVSKKRDENIILSKKNFDLSILSNTDELTGIFNRRGFMKFAQNELKAAVDANKTGLVIFGDIDGLKKINDTYGHDAGDRAILAEVQVLKKAFREADTIGRLGGDEFAVLSISLSLEQFEKLKIRIEDFCSEWNRNSGEPFRLSISLGAVAFSKSEKNLEKLLKLADVEQYREKEKHKRNCR